MGPVDTLGLPLCMSLKCGSGSVSVQSIQCFALDVHAVTVNCSAIDFGALLEEMKIVW